MPGFRMDPGKPGKTPGKPWKTLGTPYKFIGFGDLHGPKPYKFIGFGDLHGPKPYKFIGFGDLHRSRRIRPEIFDFDPGLKRSQTKPKIPGTVPTDRHTTIPNDSGPISACFDDDPKLLNCEIAPPPGPREARGPQIRPKT